MQRVVARPSPKVNACNSKSAALELVAYPGDHRPSLLARATVASDMPNSPTQRPHTPAKTADAGPAGEGSPSPTATTPASPGPSHRRARTEKEADSRRDGLGPGPTHSGLTPTFPPHRSLLNRSAPPRRPTETDPTTRYARRATTSWCDRSVRREQRSDRPRGRDRRSPVPQRPHPSHRTPITVPRRRVPPGCCLAVARVSRAKATEEVQ